MPPEQRAAHGSLAPYTHAIGGCVMMAHSRKLLHQPVLVVAREDVATLREDTTVRQAWGGHYDVAVLS